ncbi:MAG: hypothetical protein D6679_02435 [Candidatus Hydrogenedentota bacterium]|nr:MAG: hypothetical protein D6679_02435 [Candidatus Hydrogenedentota bacterium]
MVETEPQCEKVKRRAGGMKNAGKQSRARRIGNFGRAPDGDTGEFFLLSLSSVTVPSVVF